MLSYTSTRREFLKTAASLAGSAALSPALLTTSARAATPAPSERIAMGFIGLGGMGTGDLGAFLGFPEVQAVAVCDVDTGSDRYAHGAHLGLDNAKAKVEACYAEQTRSGLYRGVVATQDFRRILERDDIDAVFIATPDHWHSLMVIEAVKAGKDVFCQKPMSVFVREGRAAVHAVGRYGRVFQCGTQRRSSAKCRFSCELVRNGRIGVLRAVKVGLPKGHLRVRPEGPTDPMPVPEGLDYEMWLGPAPWAPYTLERCHFTFRWIEDYSGGYITDWGAHYCDMAHWGMDADTTGPVTIEGRGKYPEATCLWNAAIEFHVTLTYASGCQMILSSDLPWGVRFEGTEGWVDLEGDTEPKSLLTTVIRSDEIRLPESPSQHQNFLECVRTRKTTTAPAEVAHRSVSVCHLANIGVRLGRKLQWDPVAEVFVNDEEANSMLSRAIREPWQLSV